MKQLVASMDNLERKHYERKISKLDTLIEQVYESGERVTMEELLDRVSLSEAFKEKNTPLKNFESPGAKAFEVQSMIKKRRGTDRPEAPKLQGVV